MGRHARDVRVRRRLARDGPLGARAVPRPREARRHPGARAGGRVVLRRVARGVARARGAGEDDARRALTRRVLQHRLCAAIPAARAQAHPALARGRPARSEQYGAVEGDAG